jgi:2-keto-3-deoxy-L-rhamnonate aldolase RhmA
MQRIVASLLAGAVYCSLVLPAMAQAPAASPKLYNTVKQKLNDGKQVIGATIVGPDPSIYCAVANAGFDYIMIEMQHSTISYGDAARMIWACRGAPAMPFIRIPDVTESDIQKATDIGALGIIVPTVDTSEKARAAVKWTRYPPVGYRSQGTGQGPSLWGSDYRQTYNDNVLVIAMIETPTGAAAAEQIASVPGVDVIFIGSGDLTNFSGKRQGDPEYEAMVVRIKDATLKAGKKLAGPLTWKDRPGFTFLMGPTEINMIRSGAQSSLGTAPAR